VTVSHLRFGPRPIRSSYLIEHANFVACHQYGFLERVDVLRAAEEGATVLLNSPYGPDEVWEKLPLEAQEQIIERRLELHVIDAYAVAHAAGMGKRINTVMQPCFFALSGVLPADEAIAAIKQSIEKTYAKRGREVVERNWAAVDAALGALAKVDVPAVPAGELRRRPPVPAGAPDFVQRVTARLLAGEGDLLPVSALPVDGTFPTGTSRWEKRGIAQEIPIWDPDICIDCGRCALYCPHTAIQMKVFEPEQLADAPGDFASKDFRSKELPEMRLTIQVSPDDCTGCGVCVDMCPAKSKEEVKHRAINMEPRVDHLELERERFDFFDAIPALDPTLLKPTSVKAAQTREPLFEYSGACAGCGETPYLKLLSQLFGDRMLVANATGCSSIFGGNLPTTPWSVNAEGRGPAWANSLFEDNAEFGLGMRLAYDHNAAHAQGLLSELRDEVGAELVEALLSADQSNDGGIALQRQHVEALRERLATIESPRARLLEGIVGELVRRSLWIVGGDGWAYDIGSAGLDHVLASGRNVNVIVLDTEVYSNTGGQASKATPRGAVAKFAAAGKRAAKKDLGMIASSYGDVYVAQIAIGANPMQTVKALLEADAWPGPSLVIAYSSCIAHGIDMTHSMSHQDDAVKSGYWPLYRYHPGLGEHEHPFQLDCKAPSIPVTAFTEKEGRFAMLARSDPDASRSLLALAQADVDERWRLYQQLAVVERTVAHEDNGGGQPAEAEVSDGDG
jgi:pyruvate-ferredoxin/flavodoxin oxidoreductase